MTSSPAGGTPDKPICTCTSSDPRVLEAIKEGFHYIKCPTLKLMKIVLCGNCGCAYVEPILDDEHGLGVCKYGN